MCVEVSQAASQEVKNTKPPIACALSPSYTTCVTHVTSQLSTTSGLKAMCKDYHGPGKHGVFYTVNNNICTSNNPSQAVNNQVPGIKAACAQKYNCTQ